MKAHLLIFAMLVQGCSSADFQVGQAPADDAETSETSIGIAKETGIDSGSLETLETDDSGAESSPEVSSTDTGFISTDSSADSWASDTGFAETGPVTTSFDFPTSKATVHSGIGGLPTDVYTTGFRFKGDYTDETVYRGSDVVRSVAFDLDIDDSTGGCATGSTHHLDVSLNGKFVGQLSWTTGGTTGSRTLHGEFKSLSVSPTPTGKVTIHVEMAEAICTGGGSWTWQMGGYGVFST